MNHLFKIIPFLIIIGSLDWEIADAQEITFERDSPPTSEMLMQTRETFEYEVKYGFLTLGWVDVELLPDSTFNGQPVKHLRTRIRSNSRIPFVGKDVVNYESLFDFNDEWFYSYEFWRDDIHDENYERLKVHFDRADSLVYFFEEGEPTDTLSLEEPASGGDVVFYYSRMFAGIEEPYELPVYIEGEKGTLTASSGPDTEMRSYDAFDDDVETYYSEGRTDIDGPFGFSGSFKSWFMTDDLRIPVEAHVKVIFGNVKVRLIDYEREE
ncbi:MAG: DUF3108 domain-containing protein [Bacteroidota bacterium]